MNLRNHLHGAKDWEECAQTCSKEEVNHDFSEPGFPEHSQHTQE